MKHSLFAFAQKTDYLFMAIGSLGAICMGIIFPFVYLFTSTIVGSMDSSTTGEQYYESVIEILPLMVLSGLLFTMCGYIAVLCWVIVGARQGYYFRETYFKKVLSMDCEWYDSNSIEELPSSIASDCLSIEQATGDKIFILIFTISIIVSGEILSLFMNFQLTLVSLMFGPFVISGMLLTKKGLEPDKSYKDNQGVPEEVLQEIKTVCAFNAQKEESQRYCESLRESKEFIIRKGQKVGFGAGIASSGYLFAMAAMMIGGAYMIQEDIENWSRGNKIGVPEVFVIINISIFVFNNIASLIPCIKAINKGKQASQKIIDLINSPSERIVGSMNPIKGDIVFQNVSFQYNSDCPVLKDISFNLEIGSSLGIVGSTGSGKSSLVSLILRFYSHSSGEILLDGIPIEYYNIKHLRKSISLVSQEPLLFDTSVLENIKMADTKASIKDIEKAAKKACALEFIEKMPGGFFTRVGLKGSFLSGGQKQRIAIARALLRKCTILILDEATSALDKETEKTVTKSLEESTKQITRIGIAQNLLSIRDYDKIIVLESGTIIEEGSHQELIRKRGKYAELERIQNIAYNSNFVEVDMNENEERQKLDLKEEKANNSEFSKKILDLSKKKWLFFGVLGSILIGFSYPFVGICVGTQTNAIVMDDKNLMQTTYYNAFVLVSIGLLCLIGMIIQSISYPRLASDVTTHLRQSTFKLVLSYDASFFDKNSSTILMSRLADDCEALNSIGGNLIGLFVGAIVTISVAHGVSAVFSWKISLVLLCLLPVFIFSSLITIMAQMKGIVSFSYEKCGILVSDCVLNHKSIKSLNLQNLLVKQFKRYCSDEMKNTFYRAHSAALSYGLGFGLLFVLFAFMYWYSSKLFKDGEISYDFILISMYTARSASDAILFLSCYAGDIGSGLVGARRIFKLRSYIPSIDIKDKSGRISPIQGKIEFCNVSFFYPVRDKLALNGVNFLIEPGEKALVQGRSGSGKSTIVQLILRFYDTNRGTIYIDDVPISQYNLKFLRKNIGVVSQEPVLFGGSVCRNIRYGTHCKLNEVEKVAEIASIDFDLGREVGFKGSKLSGGQKQRVAIARALIKKPRVLILDEATSALDNLTQSKIAESLKDFEGTMLIISHRQNIETDKTIIIESGKVISNQ